MEITNETLELVENIAFRSWPAEIEEPFYSWKLRANRGVTKRANSVFTIGKLPAHKKWLEEVESFYNEKAIVPCFYISALSPYVLDDILNQENYEKVGEMYILHQDTKEILQVINSNLSIDVQIEYDASPGWVSSFLELEEYDERLRSYFEIIFHKILLEKAFLTIYLNNDVAAVGTIAIQSGWGYVSNVVVNKRYRQQGIGTQLMRHLAWWAHQNHTERLFLQVLKENKVALSLYERLGFSVLTESHYRMKIDYL